ncbi:CTP synthase [Yasminevirus sp. GU-2018]|uniref:CTP synthase (glutamine hydrolyzing) n=1 Tax=Yasminevirus sp. GU-2018 TaxID=2420051 RepID=A0A5K0U9L0_9VIRU|nr:CTP synthase [Yasminevirus sp. GU-2018]
MKYLVVVGGVISGIGKGIFASSCGVLLKSMGYKVTAIKIDPYLNIDAGLMNPNEHGEVFVLNDGGEVDLDLGNYERFLDTNLTSRNNITTGKIYQNVISKEREGKFLGKTVQVVPHITNEIQEWIESVATSDPSNEICTIELGGTIGDIESAPFSEALRQFRKKVSPENFCLVQVTLVPGKGADQKSKPTQACVKDLRGLGLVPNIIACRCKDPLNDEVREKISLFCDVEKSHIISFQDCDTIYEVPILLRNLGLEQIFIKELNLNPEKKIKVGDGGYYDRWCKMAERFHPFQHSPNMRILSSPKQKSEQTIEQKLDVDHSESEKSVTICIVGKYTKTTDAYFSIMKALEHASAKLGIRVTPVLVESTDLSWDASEASGGSEGTDSFSEGTFSESNKKKIAWEKLGTCDGVLVPGGFGNRGVNGKLAAIRYARESDIPFFGICFGMQLAVIEYARNVLNLEDSNSTELNPDCEHKIVINMPEIRNDVMGGTQRLGARDTVLFDSRVKTIYHSADTISERHRHRYEVNPLYVERIELAGLKFVGKDTKMERMEIIELDDHPFFVGTQFHPEYLSRPLQPAPLFEAFVRASYENKRDE